MPLYVYAFSDAAPALDGLTGIQGERIEGISLPGACAIVGRDVEALTPTRENLERQDRLVRMLHDRAAALLPARFATTVDDERILLEHPRLQPDRLSPCLVEVRGREQMTARVASNRPYAEQEPETIEGTGRDYLERRARTRHLPREVEEVMSAVAALVRGERVERGRVPGLVATIYHLVDRGRADDYRTALSARASMAAPLSIAVTGPAPAYAFGPASEL